MKRAIALMLLLAVSTSAQPKKVADKKFWTMIAASFASAIADEEITQHALQTGRFREANPLLGRSRKTAYPVLFGIAGAQSLLSYKLKKDNSKIWWLPQTIGIGTHGFGVSYNLALSR